MADEQIVTSIVAKADLSSLVSEVHRATASLQQLQRELLTSNKSIAAATKVANNSFRDNLIGSGMYSSHFVNLQSDIDKFGKNLDGGRLKLRDYFSTFRTHIKTSKGLIRELAQEQVMLQNAVMQPLGRNAQGLMQYNVMIPRGLDAVRNKAQLANMQMQIMNRALSEGATSLINWGKNTQWAGRQLTVGLTLPLAMFGSQAARAFRGADQELTRLVKVYGDISGTASADLKKIRQDVVATSKELSNAMGVSFKETIGLAADIAATGQQGEQLLSSLKETTRLAVLGEVDRAEAMKATLAIQTAFKSNTQELTESINFLNAVENQTSTTLNDLVEAIPKAGTVVKQLGGDVEDLALYLTAMREGGVNASEAANALKSGLASMINPTKQTIGVMSEFGIDIMGMVEKNTGNTTGMILSLQQALDQLDPLSKARALEQMFGKFQFARMAALFNNLGKEGSQTLQVMDLMNASASQLANIAGRELELVTESASGKYRRAIEGLRASLADIGEEFLGVATKFINAFTKVLDFFNGLPEPIKKAVTYLGGFTAVIGPIIMLTGLLANFFGYITKGIVTLRAFFQGSKGWRMLTPEIIAAQKASELVEKSFYSDAKAAEVLHGALSKLIADYVNLEKTMMKNAVATNPVVATTAGNVIMNPIRREVDPTSPYVGDPDTRAMSHINPRDPNNPASLMGVVPGAIPVNRGISKTPQIYMQERLPDVPGLTTVKGISTGIVAGEAARFHALMATLGMQTETEVAALKKTIALGGTVSAELLETFDDILPMTTRLADNAATQSAAIVAQLRAGKLTVDQAKLEIMAVNAQLEASLKSEVAAYAASRGRTIDFSKAPLMGQSVTDANAQFTLRDLYKKEGNKAVMEEFGRLRGIRTFGAPYSIQTTRIPKFEEGGLVEGFGPSKTVVSGPTSINYDDRLGSVPLDGYVLNQGASLNPNNSDLVAMAPYTFENGGHITAALTPGEVVFGPKIHRIPGMFDALEAANNGYSLGGQIMRGTYGYGKENVLSIWARLLNSKDYPKVINAASVASDAVILSHLTGMPIEDATNITKKDYDDAISYAKKAAKKNGTSKTEEFVKARTAQLVRLSKEFPNASLILDAYSSKNKYGQKTKALGHTQIPTVDYTRKVLGVVDQLRASGMITDAQAKKVFGILGGLSDGYDPIHKSHFMTARQSATIFQAGELEKLLIANGMSKSEAAAYAGVTGVRSNNYVGQSAGLMGSFNTLFAGLARGKGSDFKDELSPFQDEAKSNYISGIRKLKKDLGIKGKTTWSEIIKQLTLSRMKSGRSMVPTIMGALSDRGSSWVRQLTGPAVASFVQRNAGGPLPGGRVVGGRINYGNVMSILSPEKMLKVLALSKEFSSRKSLGSFADQPITSYGHRIASSSGKSYPIPGVSGVYKNENGDLVFLKGVPNGISAKAEVYGTRMAREVFELDAPEQTIRTLANPLDPSGKAKLLGLESPFDPKFAVGGTGFTPDQMIRQTIASLLMGNKDLSRSNVYGNVLADVGPAGVFAKASMNTEYAEVMNSMEKQAMINLLAVRGGARKDFAYDTAPIAAGMTPRQYGSKMKTAMKKMRPRLEKFIESLPEQDRGPYVAMLSRLDDGLKVNWSKYQPIHANPAFNKGGGVVRSGRKNYGKKYSGSPERVAALKARDAERARIERENREATLRSHAPAGSKAIFTGELGREGRRATPINVGGTMMPAFGGVYNPAQAMINQMLAPIRNAAFMYGGHLQALSKSIAHSVMHGAKVLAHQAKQSVPYIKSAYLEAGKSIVNSAKTAYTSVLNSVKTSYAKIVDLSRSIRMPIYAESRDRFAAAYGIDPKTGNPYNWRPGMMTGPIGLTPWQMSQTQDGRTVESRKQGYYGFRKREYRVDGQSISRAEAQRQGLIAPRGQMGMGAQMGIGMAGMTAGSALMAKGQTGLGMGVMLGSSILPMMMPQITSGISKAKNAAISAANAFKGGAGGVKMFVTALTAIKAAGPLLAITAIAAGVAFLIKKTREWNKDAQLRFGMNAKAAEQAGIKYTSLADKMQLVAQRQIQLQNAGKSGMAGISGLNMSMEELKEAKDFAKENLGEYVASFKRANSENIAELASNVKAQFIAAGMSVEDANKKIMGMIAAAGKSKASIAVMTNSAFAGIKDSSSAAEFSVRNLSQAIQDGNKWNDQYKTKIIESISSVIDLTDKAILATAQQKNAAGQLKGEYEALIEVTSRMKNQGFNTVLSTEAFSKLPIELQAIATQSDTIAGIYAKWRLYVKGVQIDLKGVSSETAQMLDSYLTAFSSAQDKLIQEGRTAFKDGLGIGQMDGSFKKIGFTMASLQSIIDKTGREAVIAQQKAAQSTEAQNERLQKQIDLIREAANEKLKALDATEKRESYEIQLQKARLTYQNSIAKGDFEAAERARLDLIALQKAYQAERARLAIQEEAARKEKALQEQQKKNADAEKKRQIQFQNVQNEAARAQEALNKIQSYTQQYKDLLLQQQTNEFISDPKLKAAAIKQTDNQLQILVKEIQSAAMAKKGEKGADIAKDIKSAFSKFFDSNGNPLSFGKLGPKGTVISSNQMGSVLGNDMKMLQSQATLITGGTTLEMLRADLVKAITGKDTTSNVTSTPAPANTGKAGGPSTASTTTNSKGERVMLKDGLLEISMASFNGGGRTLKAGDIVQIGKNGGIIAVPTSDPLVTKKSGAIEIVVVDKDKQRVQYRIKYYEGGKVTGPGSGTSDSIPAMLSNGEFVVNAASAARIGYDNLHAINNYAMGGIVGNASMPKYNIGGLLGRSQRLMMHAGGTPSNVTIGDIHIHATPGMDERALARAAAQEVFAVMSNRSLQMGGQAKVIR